MKDTYPQYRKKCPKEKKKRIEQAQQSQAYRRPNPQGIHEFNNYNPIQFIVQQDDHHIKLFTYSNVPEKIDAVVIIFHGLNSHVGHAAHIAYAFSMYRIASFGYDYRGFGRSEGKDGYTESLQTHLKDAKKFIGIIKKMYQGLPIFCLGLSLGGLTSYHLTLQNPKLFDGAILMAPALKNSVGGFLVGLTKTLGKILPKSMKLMKPIYGRAAKNPQVTEDIKNDKYAFAQRASLSTINMLVTAMDTSPATFKDYKCPFIVIQGGLDKLVDPQGAFELYDKAQSPQKQILFYQDMWHDIWHEEEIHEIVERVVEWILKMINRIKKNQKQQTEPTNQGFCHQNQGFKPN